MISDSNLDSKISLTFKRILMSLIYKSNYHINLDIINFTQIKENSNLKGSTLDSVPFSMKSLTHELSWDTESRYPDPFHVFHLYLSEFVKSATQIEFEPLPFHLVHICAFETSKSALSLYLIKWISLRTPKYNFEKSLFT